MRIIGILLWFFYTIMLARTLDQNEVGIVLYALNFILVATTFSTVGTEVALIRFASQMHFSKKYNAYNKIVRFSRVIAIGGSVFCIAMLLVLFYLRDRIDIISNIPVFSNLLFLGIISLCILASTIMVVNRDSLRSAGRLVEALIGWNIIRAILPLILSLLSSAFFYIDEKLALLYFLLGMIASLILELVFLHKARKLQTTNDLDDQVSFIKFFKVGLGIWPGDIGAILMVRSTGLILGTTIDVEFLAVFFIAERLASLAQFLTDAVRVAIMPKISQSAEKRQLNLKLLQNTVGEASLLMFIAGAIGSLAVLTFGWPMLYFIGPEYSSGYYIISLFILSQASWTILGPTAVVLNMSGLHKFRSLVSLIALCIQMPLTYFASLEWGIMGAMSVMITITWLSNALLHQKIAKELNIACGVFAIRFEQIDELLEKSKQYLSNKLPK